MSKNIVLCSDGTGQDGLKQTNVSCLYGMLDLSDRRVQIACYDPGVGTAPHPDVSAEVARADDGVVRVPVTRPWPPGVRWLGKVAGLGFGYGLFQNVKELYEVLIDHYADGDRIFLFGFSRGAFTARVLAGLLCRCGLLFPKDRERYAQAFGYYEPHFEGLPSDRLSKLKADIAEFRRAYSRPCRVEFLGLWDTVKAVGYVWPRSMPHTRHNPIVKRVRQALAIGERRSFFAPTTWGGLDADTVPGIEGQDVHEIWFPGDHADVGGGHEDGLSDLAKLSLRWMISETSDLELRFDETRYDRVFSSKASPTFTPHDLLESWGWRVSERAPRWELVNDPPPPRRAFTWTPTGHRGLGESAREGVVLIEERAKEVYGAKATPWSDIDPKIEVRFVSAAGLRGAET